MRMHSSMGIVPTVAYIPLLAGRLTILVESYEECIEITVKD